MPIHDSSNWPLGSESERKPAMPSRLLKHGMPYTPAAQTDIRQTFARVLAEQAKGKPANVQPMKRRAK